MAVSEYVLTDRATATRYSVQVDDSQLKFTSTANAASPEPIFEDDDVPSIYWRMYIDDGQLALESTLTVQDDQIFLDDITTTDVWQIEVHAGQLFFDNTAIDVTLSLLPWLPRRRRR